MNIGQLTSRAVALREIFTKYELKVVGKEWSTENIAQGLVGDIGDLMKFVMAKEGLRKIDDLDKKLEHELSDCLWSLLVIAQEYGIDLEQAYLQTTKEIEDVLAKKIAEVK